MFVLTKLEIQLFILETGLVPRHKPANKLRHRRVVVVYSGRVVKVDVED